MATVNISSYSSLRDGLNTVLSKPYMISRQLLVVTLISLLNICLYRDILTFQEVVFHMLWSSKELGISRGKNLQSDFGMDGVLWC